MRQLCANGLVGLPHVKKGLTFLCPITLFLALSHEAKATGPQDPLTALGSLKQSTSRPAALPIAVPADQAPSGSDLSRVMIDMSSNNRELEIDEPLRSKFGIELVFHRASLGVGTPDKSLQAKLKDMSNRQFFAGAYHVIYPTSAPHLQFLDFISRLQKSCVDGQPLLLAVDWEGVCTRHSLVGKTKQCVARGDAPASYVDAFISELTQFTGKPVIVYTGRATLEREKHNITPLIARSPLWLATYYSKFYRREMSVAEKQKPEVTPVAASKAAASSSKFAAHIGYIIPLQEDVAPWPGWTFWQFGEGKGPDISSNISVKLGKQPVDLNFFNGGRAAFRQFFAQNAWICTNN